jgi:hypothetical protein
MESYATQALCILAVLALWPMVFIAGIGIKIT